MATARPPSLLLFAFLTLIFLSSTNVTLAKSHVKKAAHAPAPAPAPAPAQVVDCSAYLVDMSDCIDFVQLGSNSTKPTATCCAGLKKVVKENERCLCDALGNSEEFGIKLNMTRAVAMPSACGVDTPSAANCKTSVAPASAPAPASGSVAAVPTPPPPGNSFAMRLLPLSSFTVLAGISMSIHFLIG